MKQNMKARARCIAFFVLCTAMAMAQTSKKVTITVQNPAKESRSFEMVEANAQQIKNKLGTEHFIVTDADGKEIPSQQTYNGGLIFQANVGGKGKSIYYAVAGTPQQYDKRATGRLFTERGDEFGWENDRVAYRIYGHGGAVGYDLFNKSTSKLMLDWWYASEQDQEMRSVSKKLHDRGYHDLADQVYNAFCYHINHGQGMDCYTVGPTLGGGANALLNADGSLCMPKCYQKYEILDNGPLRFTVKLTYPAIEYNGKKLTETRLITLDAGTSFCKATVSYDRLDTQAQIASGVVVHKQNPNAYVLNKEAGYVGYEDLGDGSPYNAKYRAELEKEMGRIYVGTVYADKLTDAKFAARENGIATGHVLGIGTIKPNMAYTYYFGTAWDHNEELGIRSLADWEALLAHQASVVQAPMKVIVK